MKNDNCDTGSLSDRLCQCYTGALYDVLREMGFPDQVLPHDIRPLDSQLKIAGQVYTIEGERDDTLHADQSLLKWCEFLSSVPEDHVVVCQPHDATLAHMGELSAETLAFKNVLGYIVDGGCRDTTFIDKINFPVFCKYHTPADIVGKWMTTSFGRPIIIGKVKIYTGDYVLADRDGVVIIPQAIASEVVNHTEEVLQTENMVRKSILQGIDPVEAYLKYGRF